MSSTGYLEASPWVKEQQTEWWPTLKVVLAFIVGLLLLSPAVLGLYWEHLLPR